MSFPARFPSWPSQVLPAQRSGRSFLPERKWKRRIVQGAGGAISAVFLGGILGHVLDNLTDAGFYAYSAAGFIMGSGGESAVKALQDRILGADK